jgi:hypothetical protein
VDDQSIARQRLSKHVITQATVEEWVFACRCWVTKHQWIRRLAKRSVVTAAVQWCDKHATIEAEMFSLWLVRRFITNSEWREFLVFSTSVQFSRSSRPVQFEVVLNQFHMRSECGEKCITDAARSTQTGQRIGTRSTSIKQGISLWRSNAVCS